MNRRRLSPQEDDDGDGEDQQVAENDGHRLCPIAEPVPGERADTGQKCLPRQGREERSSSEEGPLDGRHLVGDAKPHYYGGEVNHGGRIDDGEKNEADVGAGQLSAVGK